MITPSDMIKEIKAIKEALNTIEIHGEQNANNLLYAIQRCNGLINAINIIIDESKIRKNDTATEAGEQ